MSQETAFTGKRVLLDSGATVGPATIYVDSAGKVARIESEYRPDGASLDAGDKLLMPGIVDGHVHINQPGRTQWEGVVTASHSAAAGGVTTIVDMPLNCIPSTVTVGAYRQKRESFQKGMWVDVGTWGGVVPGNALDLAPMLDAGARGFKCFLCDSGVDEFPPVNEEQLRAAMVELKKKNGLIMFHAEMDTGATVDAAKNPIEYNTFLDSRPPNMEVKAIDLVIQMCREFAPHVPCHIVHLSAADALPAIRAAKAEGLPLTVETCFHYLSISSEDIPSRSTEYKCCPPIRGKENRDKLWDAVLDGTIDFIVSDHSPCTPDLKLHPCCGGKIAADSVEGDFVKAWGGIASVGIGLPLLWTEGQKRGLSFQDIVRLICERTAVHSGLRDRKGKIAVGLDADFVVWSPEEENKITADKLHFRNKLTPYKERVCKGAVHQTVVRGSVVYDVTKTTDDDKWENKFSKHALGQWLETPIARSN
ncbi:Allantoinase [Coemansia sp. RSA 1813]|nr:Allantoinase [Coemansia sp. RSA 1646]KAJ1770509.1 Allantoinase [Coemansia sp. RSA 1843]KAJ2092954.1 Allantoinase [Coemansia sp. RSA 986]KAJ2216275.1 Allantoinase [Coemansia sp. RSA 487]KAJ2570553.1 Allantoinase [Coemansia sp. RSA 1813]